MQSSAANSPSYAKVYWILGLIGGLFFLGAIGLGIFVFKVARSHRIDPFPADAWAKRSVDRLTVELPFELKPLMNAPIPPNVRAMYDTCLVYENQNTNANGTVVVMHLHPKDGVDFSLHGAADGAMRQGAVSGTRNDPQQVVYDMKETKIDGFPAKRASYQGKRVDGDLFIEGHFVQAGRDFYGVSVVYRHARDRESAIRVLKSMRVAGKP